MGPTDDVDALAALSEPSRRALYDYVASRPGPVGRDEAADAVGLPRHSVKFHLDRLVEVGLLEVEFRRLSGRSGPGAGRPAKLYRRSGRPVSVSLPERRYDIAGAVLADAVERAARDDVGLARAVDEAARGAGRRLVEEQPAPRARRPLRRVAEVLRSQGYEPRVDDAAGELVLANCPFDRLAREHTELVCSMNLALVEGAVDALGCLEVRPRLEPTPDLCCVRASAPRVG